MYVYGVGIDLMDVLKASTWNFASYVCPTLLLLPMYPLS